MAELLKQWKMFTKLKTELIIEEIMNITLEPYEIIMGAMVGVRRRVSSIAKKLDRGSTQGDPWGIDVEGAEGTHGVHDQPSPLARHRRGDLG